MVLMALTAIGVAALMYIFAGVDYESRISAYARVFPGIVDRAIQLERIGEIGIPEVNWYIVDAPFPTERRETMHALAALRDAKGEIDCSLDISVSDLDVRKYSPSMGVMLSYRPLRYLVVFNGAPPDIEAFLSSRDIDSLLGPVENFSTDPSAPGFLSDGLDLRTSYNIAAAGDRNSLHWESDECGKFSYIVFSKDR